MTISKTLRGLAALAAFIIAGISATLISSPAHAAVRTCTDWPGGTGQPYPKNGNLKKCFPAPLTSAETYLQNDMMNNVNAAISNLTANEKSLMSSKGIVFYVFYNGVDAFDTLGDPNGVKPGETGRSYVWTNTTPVVGPKTALWPFTPNQWQALNGARPTTYNLQQFMGTAVHEAGHHMDRVWAQINGYAPTIQAIISTNSTLNPIAAQSHINALNFDGARLTAADIQWMKINFPHLIKTVKGVDRLATNEVFAEQFARIHGGGAGGASGAEATFLLQHFSCSNWVVTYLKTNNGNTPPTPATGSTCYNKSSWNDPPLP